MYRTSTLVVGLALMLAACNLSQAAPDEDRRSRVGFELGSAGQVAHGERVSRVLGCSGCHNDNLAGRDWSDELGTLWTANLTVTVRELDDAQLKQLILSGARSDRALWAMPSHLFTQLDETDMTALIAFLRSKPLKGKRHPEPTMGRELTRAIEAGALKSSRQEVAEFGGAWPPDVGAKHALGRYIVRSTCAECHAMDLRGGKPPLGTEPRPDLRIVAAYDRDALVTLLRTGKPAGDRKLGLMSEVAVGRYRHLTDAEIGEVYGYIKAVATIDP